MANNKITTKSYFVKRLRDGGYVVDKVGVKYFNKSGVKRSDEVKFADKDTRRWAVLIDNGVASVFAFCHSDGSFSFYDGQRYIKTPNLRLKTDSIEVIVEYLNHNGIINKHSKYATVDA